MNKERLEKLKAKLKKRLRNSGLITDKQTLEDLIEVIEGVIEDDNSQ